MSLQAAFSPSASRQLERLEKQIQGLRNEMEFVEILAQFWPFPNMVKKMERLEEQLAALTHQAQNYQRLQAG